MASLLAKIFDFQANIPVTTLDPLDAEFQQLVDVLNGTATGTKLLTKASDATDPVYELDQLGAGPILECKQNGTIKLTVTNAGLLNPASSAVNTGFNADQVDGIEGANIAQLDTHVTAWMSSFGVNDPSTASTLTILGNTYVTPDGTAITLTKIKVVYQNGSHTAGGALDFAIQHRTAASTWSSVNNITGTLLNDTNDDKSVVYTNDIGNVSLAAGDTLAMFINTRSGTISERDVSVVCIGTQRLT